MLLSAAGKVMKLCPLKSSQVLQLGRVRHTVPGYNTMGSMKIAETE